MARKKSTQRDYRKPDAYFVLSDIIDNFRNGKTASLDDLVTSAETLLGEYDKLFPMDREVDLIRPDTLFPMGALEVDGPKKTVIIRALCDFRFHTPLSIKEHHQVGWGWSAVAKLQGTLNKVAEEVFRLDVPIPPQYKSE